MDRTTIGSLPNELLISILSQLPTRALLPLAAVDRRFYLVTLRILQERLRRATSLHDHRLILECYHPSARLSTPYLYCNYLYTDGFDYDDDDNHNDAAAHASESAATATATTTPLASLRGIYSHFRPVAQDENNRRGNRAGARRHHAPRRAAPPESPPRPAHDVYLDEGELFSQLCTVTNLVRLGPRPDLFRSHVNVSDGLVRVRRAWLAAQAGGGRTTTAGAARGGVGKEEEEEDGAGGAGAVLWADAARNVGLRFRVAEKDISGEQQQPVLVASDEELAVAFRLEFEELLVRTSRLLIMMEKSDAQEEVGAEGKAIVLASIF